MKMDNCGIIEDLLPSYCDGLTGTESNDLIRQHIKNCPQCAKRLQDMSAQQPVAVMDHRGAFGDKLREYERKHRIKQLSGVLCAVIVVFVLVLLWSNSKHIAQWNTNIRMSGDGKLIANEVPVDEHWVANYYIYSMADGYHLVTLQKHTFWNIWYLADDTKAADGEMIIAGNWFGETNHINFDGEFIVDFQYNWVYIGNNAIAPLDLESTEIPGDVSVEVNQWQSHYWVLVSSDNIDAINQLNLTEKLVDLDMISGANG